jgi:hypothetical protein
MSPRVGVNLGPLAISPLTGVAPVRVITRER